LLLASSICTALPAAAGSIVNGDSWHLSIAPFPRLGKNLEGMPSIASEKGPPELAFTGDFLENDPHGRQVQLKARKEDLTFFANYRYIDPDLPTGARTEDDLLDLRAQITRLGASYRFATWNDTDFEVLAGRRYRAEDIPPEQKIEYYTRKIENDEWWRNTFVGLRFFNRISDNWSFVGRGDIVLGNGGTDIGWNAAAMFDYRLNDWGSFYFGYKLLALDDGNIDTGMERYSYDALQQGPFLGVTIRW